MSVRPWRPGPGLALNLVVIGGTLAVCGAGMIVCAAVAAAGDERAVAALALPGAGTLLLGLLAARSAGAGAHSAAAIRPASGFLAVTGAWALAAAVGAVPFLAAGSFGSPIDAYFEGMSGVTTTGATLLGVLEMEPDGILLWRNMMQWLGGIGIVVLVVAVAPVSGAGLQRAFYAEMSGMGDERLTPRIVDTAKIIAGIYLGFSALAVVAYLLAGLGLFDAVAHMFSSVATGGFSTRTASIAAFESVAVELVAIAFMVLGSINFAFYWRTVRGGTSPVQRGEVAMFLAILVAAIGVITATLLLADDSSGWNALRGAAFSATSIMTTTGYTTVDFDLWNDTARLLMLGLMVVGGCAGSTAGGMKVIRAVLLGKIAAQELRRQLQPSAVQVLRLRRHAFAEPVRAAVLGFGLLYTAVLALGTVALVISGLDLVSGAAAAVSGLNMIGPALGDVGALENFEAVPPGGRLVVAALMLIGRLEIFTVVALLVAVRIALTRR